MKSISEYKIVTITPMKDEIENIPGLIKSIERLDIRIALWIIIDDASSDGSGNYMREKIKNLKNVEKGVVYYLSDLSQEYKLGEKYSKVVKYGFEKLAELQEKESFDYDYVGILDADCKVHENYYSKLLEKFYFLPNLGIASGIHCYYKNGENILQKRPARFARGSIRLWRRECFEECGYIIGKSADAISSAMAWIKGWNSQSFTDAIVDAREVGTRVDPKYYGNAAYYLHISFYFIIIKCIYFTIIGKFSRAKYLFLGYIEAKKKKDRGKLDKKIICYFRLLPIMILIENIKVMRNRLILWYIKLKNKTLIDQLNNSS